MLRASLNAPAQGQGPEAFRVPVVGRRSGLQTVRRSCRGHVGVRVDTVDLDEFEDSSLGDEAVEHGTCRSRVVLTASCEHGPP